VKVLAFDPATILVGVACLESVNGTIRLLDCGKVDLGDQNPLGFRLVQMRQIALDLIKKHNPDIIAIEYVRFNRGSVANFDSLSKVLLMTGVLYEAAAGHRLPLALLSASQVRGLIGNKEKASGKKKKVTKSIVETRFKSDILAIRGALFKASDLDITDAIALGWVSFSTMEKDLIKYGVIKCPACGSQSVHEIRREATSTYKCDTCGKEFDETTPR